MGFVVGIKTAAMVAANVTTAMNKKPLLYPDCVGNPSGSNEEVTMLDVMAAPTAPPMVRMLAFMPLATPV